MKLLKLRQEIIRTVCSFGPAGLSIGTSGNVSVRTQDGFLITPTGVAYAELKPASIIELDLSGKRITGKLLPSSEWRIHAYLYRKRPEVKAIVHVHSTYATAVSCIRQTIPAIHYHISLLGGDSVRCADYATFGTRHLSVNAVHALEGHYACLLANHGQLALGDDLTTALKRAIEVEQLARLYCIASAVGKPVVLDQDEVKINLEKFRHYGKQET